MIATIDFGSIRAGEWLPTVDFCVDELAARRYAVATTTAAAATPQFIPPLALVALALAAMTELMPLPPSTMHVGQDVEFTSAVRVGSVVEARFRLDWRRCSTDRVVSSFSFDLTADGEPCAHGRVLLRSSAEDLSTSSQHGQSVGAVRADG